MPAERLRIVICRPGEKPVLQDIRKDLDAYRAIVEGSIELVSVSAYLRTKARPSLMIVCNEDGIGKGLPMNQFGILGTFFWARRQGDHFMSVDFQDVVEIDQIMRENPATVWDGR